MRPHPTLPPAARRVFLLWLLVLLGAPAGPVQARPDRADAPARLEYLPYVIGTDGRPGAGELEEVLRQARPGTEARTTPIVVLVHGFNTTYEAGRKDYQAIARTLRQASGEELHPVVIGVHWPSYPGPLVTWLPQAVGYRFTSGLGFQNAIRNPYLERVRMAHQVGRTGLRALLLRLQEQDPEWPVHVFAHSLGSDVVLTALAPESAAREPSTEVESPERVLSLGMVVLAGADLDQDLFARRGRAEARLALDRARAWWITVPRDQEADAALELRRAAGRRDAMGNRGLTLLRDDFERLMERRGLVLDKRQIPIRHAYTDYYSRRRMRSLVASLAYLEEPDRPLARQSPLAAIDRVMLAAQPRLEAYVRRGGSTEQLYAQWRLEPDASRFGPVRVVEGRREARVVPEAASCPIPRAVQFLRPMTRLPRSEPPRHVPAL